MEIEDLEFIRDFSDQIFHVNMGIQEFLRCLDAEKDDGAEIPEVFTGYGMALLHQSEAVLELFNKFKEDMDRKYHNIWRDAYPDKFAETHPEHKQKMKDFSDKLFQEYNPSQTQ
jgi:hypothetical protein